MTYLEEIVKEGRRTGREEGRQEGELVGRGGTIEGLLRAGVMWPVIESATGINWDVLRALKKRLAGPDTESQEPTDPVR